MRPGHTAGSGAPLRRTGDSGDGVLELGRPDFRSWERVFHWSAAIAAAASLLLIGASMLGPRVDAAGSIIVLALLLIAGGALGMVVALRSGRMVRIDRNGTLAVIRLRRRPLQYPRVAHIVVLEEGWRVNVPGQPTDQPGGGLATIWAAFADGSELRIADVEWAQRDALAGRIAEHLGTTVTTRRLTMVASCG
jgi:hypothetical protein